MNRRSSALLAIVAAVLLAVTGCSSSGSTSSHPSQLNDNPGNGVFDGAQFDPAQPRPSFTLDDATNKPVDFSSLTGGHPTLLFFGYTRCPDECPETMADVTGALTHVPASMAAKTDVVFVSTDVKHDTGATIKAWLHNYSAASKATWIGLHGTQAQIDAAQAAAHVVLAEDGGETHSTQLLLYGPDDYAHVYFLQSTNEQQQIAHDLPLVAKGVTGT